MMMMLPERQKGTKYEVNARVQLQKAAKTRLYQNIQMFSNDHCLLIYFVPACIKAISAEGTNIFRAFSSLGHDFGEICS